MVDQIEECIEQTGETGFHFVDEAAPPKLLRDFAIEVLRRRLNISFWGNIRFEKSFTPDLCRLLAKAGLIMVTGGLEVADERLLKLMNKGCLFHRSFKLLEPSERMACWYTRI